MERRKCRVIVFIDGQNVHQDFRRAFLSKEASSRLGAFDPLKLAQLLVSRAPDFEEWELTATRIYVGSPVPSREPENAAAHDRQVQAWRALGVIVRPRPLQYPPEWPILRPRQKGVDVELAVDVVQLTREYEIGIIASTDTDLVPAIQAVHKLRADAPTPRICVVRYEGLSKRLSLPDTRAPNLHCFLLSRADFEAVQDLTDYRTESAASD